ncbi:MAG TPA: H(+)/Cl(-) exchange transporter ClcA [Roseiarcus sp.]|jgi:CIC family chloride channel protein
MNSELRGEGEPEEEGGSLILLTALALLVGAISGAGVALFMLVLEQADRLRDALIVRAHAQGPEGLWLVVGACALAAGIAASLVRRISPQAVGSGIPQVEAVLNGQLPQGRFRIIPVKFIGGALAIGAGLALGREGPSVHMAATLGHRVGKIFRRTWPDCRVLLAAGAGAGLATAFNAPIAGAIFVLEELVRRFELRIAIAALGASASAISVSRAILGDAPDFHLGTLVAPTLPIRPLFFVLGAFAGIVAVIYNRVLLQTMATLDRLDHWPIEARAGLIGAAVGSVAWFLPDLVGGGDPITQRTLLGAGTLVLLPQVFLLRLALGALSYSAGTPGGLFAPLLVLGAQFGLFFGLACQLAFPGLNVQPEGFAVVGMAALFTGIVRAPLTGIVLATEMTADVTMLLTMLGACAMAMLTPTVLKDPPIYDSLRERTVARERARLDRAARESASEGVKTQ